MNQKDHQLQTLMQKMDKIENFTPRFKPDLNWIKKKTRKFKEKTQKKRRKKITLGIFNLYHLMLIKLFMKLNIVVFIIEKLLYSTKDNNNKKI